MSFTSMQSRWEFNNKKDRVGEAGKPTAQAVFPTVVGNSFSINVEEIGYR